LTKTDANKKEAMKIMATQTQRVVTPVALETPYQQQQTAEVIALNADARPQKTKPSAEKPQIVEELLIEEVSIDGMCGVY
jgi:mycofactocin precursor